jgi:hypothetical protein
VALVEDGLGGGVGLGDEMLGIVLGPEELVALEAGEVFGLGNELLAFHASGYLMDVLPGLGERDQSELATLTPMAWKQRQAEV